MRNFNNRINDKTVELTITVDKKEKYYLYVSTPFVQYWVDEASDFIEREGIKGDWQITEYKTFKY